MAFVSIQFPDPHFKVRHSKRRVVTPELVATLAKFMNEDDDFGHHVLDEYDEVVLDPTIGEKVRSREERSDELGIRYSWS